MDQGRRLAGRGFQHAAVPPHDAKGTCAFQHGMPHALLACPQVQGRPAWICIGASVPTPCMAASTLPSFASMLAVTVHAKAQQPYFRKTALLQGCLPAQVSMA